MTNIILIILYFIKLCLAKQKFYSQNLNTINAANLIKRRFLFPTSFVFWNVQFSFSNRELSENKE